jgi:hypothetical protein
VRGISTHVIYVCAVPDQHGSRLEATVHWNVPAKERNASGVHSPFYRGPRTVRYHHVPETKKMTAEEWADTIVASYGMDAGSRSSMSSPWVSKICGPGGGGSCQGMVRVVRDARFSLRRVSRGEEREL